MVDRLRLLQALFMNGPGKDYKQFGRESLEHK